MTDPRITLAREQEVASRTEQELRLLRERIALRDQFAAAALTGLLATGADNGVRQIVEDEAKKRCTTPVHFIADLAYVYADAMLARRAQPIADAPAPASTAP